MKKISTSTSSTNKPVLNRTTLDSKPKDSGLYSDVNTYNKYRFYYMQKILNRDDGEVILLK